MGPITPFIIPALTALSAVATIASPFLQKKPSAPKQAKLPTLPGQVAPPATTEIDRSASEAQDREMLRRRATSGRSTILTGPLGRVAEQGVAKTVLGGA